MVAMAAAADDDEAPDVGRGGAVAVAAEGGSFLVIMEGEALARLEVEDVLGTNGLFFLSEPFCFCWWL